MTEIMINPAKQSISIEVKSESLQPLEFKIVVYESDGSTIIEEFKGNNKLQTSFIKPLKMKPTEYKGKYVRGTFNFKSADEKDFIYAACFGVLEDDIALKPDICMKGNTTNGKVTVLEEFHLV